MKLTNEIRHAIWNRLQKATLQKEVDAMKDREHLVAVAVRDQLLGKHKETIDSLPEAFVHRANYINVTGDSYRYEQLRLKEVIAVPSGYVRAEGKLETQVRSLVEDREAMLVRHRDTKRNAEAVLKKATTRQKLIELWPEIEPYCPAETETPASSMALLVPIRDLNKKLGIPVKPAKPLRKAA